MRRLLPNSLAGQTMLVLVAALTLTHVVSMWLYSSDRAHALAWLGGRNVAARVAEIVALVEDTPPEWHQRLLRAVNAPGLRVKVSPEAAVRPAAEDGWQEAAVRGLLARHLGERPVAVRLREGVEMPNRHAHEAGGRFHRRMMRAMHGVPVGGGVEVSVRLQGGGWLNFATAIPDSPSLWSGTAIPSLLLFAVAVMAASLWAVRRLARPLAELAAAAERLGRDVQAPPLPVRGPAEVRGAAQAFNDMQERLRRLVENRTHMLAAISHDLRTPITALRLRAEFVEDEEERARMLATLDEMEALIGATLAFARDDAASEARRSVDLAALLASVCDDAADAGGDVALEAPPRLPFEGRPLALKRAFRNLVDNAVKHGGAARVALRPDGGGVRVTVDDDGPGIAEAELSQVLAPFYRIDKSRSRDTGGVGLGLSVALSVVQAHGGTLSLANLPEGGLRATVTLPR